jgi:hypothetical protein
MEQVSLEAENCKVVTSGGKEHLGVDGKMILEWILGKQDGNIWARCIWLRIRTNCGLL